MQTAKRVLCLHDLSCVGRCSLTVAVPILSAMGMQACPLPCGVLSTHTGFENPVRLSTDAFVREALESYCAQGITFDAVYTGYLANETQAASAEAFLQKEPPALLVADPVMGDSGKMYRFVTPGLATALENICRSAAVITPNVTESALLLGLPACDAPFTQAELDTRLSLLQQRYGGSIIITGVARTDGTHCTACLPQDGAAFYVPYTHIPCSFPGTGDTFTAVLTGALLQGDTLQNGVHRAVSFVADAIANTPLTDTRHGLCFEPLLHTLYTKEA